MNLELISNLCSVGIA